MATKTAAPHVRARRARPRPEALARKAAEARSAGAPKTARMKLLVLAMGQRQPAWADAAWAEFAKRLPPEMRLELKALKAEPRGARTAVQCMAAEAQRIEAALPKGARRVVLDERGVAHHHAQLAERLRVWRNEGRDVAF